jgi:DNA-binding NtrC family response regulator
VVNIALPSLVERREDIPLLAYHILDKYRRNVKKRIKAISQEAMALLKDYGFPGNVRELENILERAVAMCRDEVIQVSDLPPDLSELALFSYRRPIERTLSLEEMEQDYIRHVLDLTGGVRTRAAEILGIDRASLWRKMKRYGMV